MRAVGGDGDGGILDEDMVVSQAEADCHVAVTTNQGIDRVGVYVGIEGVCRGVCGVVVAGVVPATASITAVLGRTSDQSYCR